jgi:uncharacterized surface protein with fasciclin (FAS1) repeats
MYFNSFHKIINMKKNSFKFLPHFAILLLLVIVAYSCNKIYEPISGPGINSGDPANTITKKLTGNASFSILNAALTRTGLNTVLDNPTANFTVFAPTDAAFTAAGLPLAVVNAMPLAQLTSVLQYHVIPNEKITAVSIPTSFPNAQKLSGLSIATNPIVAGLPSTAFAIKMRIYPSARTGGAWANNIPVSGPDAINASNGVAHTVAAVVAPPSRVLLDTLSRDPDFTFLIAAVVRADSDLPSTSTSRFQYALAEPFASLTVFAPTNDAFRGLVNALSAGAIPLNAPDATFIGFINSLPLLTLKGIVAYHVMGQRAFSVNFGPTPGSNYPTLLNLNVPAHPGLTISSTLVTNLGVGLSVKGAVNATAATAAPASGTNPLVDRHAINGNFFKINQVLLPQ